MNAPVDFTIIGGVSILFYFVLMGMGYPARSQLTWSTAAALLWVVNWPHFSATSYRLYHSKENIAQYPVTALFIPVLLIASVVASFASPNQVAPTLVKLFLIWSPYHFTAQSLGITLIYARRAGFFVGRLERLSLSGFVYGIYFSSMAMAEMGTPGTTYFGVTVPTIGLPMWVANVCFITMYACGAIFLLLAARWCIKNRRMLPPIVLLPAVAQYFWFIQGAGVPAYNEFVPFFHSLQYMLIAWAMQLRERMTEGNLTPSRGTVVRESFRWGVLNVIGGAGLFWVLPRLGEWTGYAPPQTPGFAEGVIIAAVQIHHFFVDGVIWKLRNPKVSSPLMVNLDDLVRPPPVARVTS